VAEGPILALFDAAGPVETPTPGVKAWLARDASGAAARPVLIKRVDAAGKGQATESLALLHPGVVRTRRWLAGGDGALYVVRDVLRGRNLRQALGGGPAAARTADAARRLLLPVIEALEYAHGQGFAHGGISPENVLVADDGTVAVSDWATADPKAPQHFLYYQGTASPAGDVRALARMVAEFLPTSGAFANPTVRGRIEGIVGRCATLADLKETVNALERLALAPVPRSGAAAPAPEAAAEHRPEASPPFDLFDGAEDGAAPSAVPADRGGGDGIPRLTCMLAEKSARVTQGGGGEAALIVKNEGTGGLIVRMIATQHAWLNVRPLELPLTIPPGEARQVAFAISAARLTPGDYRSEVYLSANATAKTAEDLRGGWFKHTAEIRITVEGGAALSTRAADGPAAVRGAAKPPYPGDAPRVAGGTGCLLAFPALLLAVLRGAGVAAP
jgi:hypothetical protein